MNSYDALVVAGGDSRRMAVLGPASDKTRISVGGRTLLQIALDAVAGARTIVVVGPRHDTDAPQVPVVWTREEPAGGGPVAAIEAGLAHVTAARVVVLAADLPFVTTATIDELRAASVGKSGAVAVDKDGRDQPLLAVYDNDALRNALPVVTSGARLGAVLTRIDEASPLQRVALPGHPPAWWDCDSPEALAQARMWS